MGLEVAQCRKRLHKLNALIAKMAIEEEHKLEVE